MSTTDPLSRIGTKETHQSQQIPGRTDQVQNHAGGYVFQIDKFGQLRRFLTIGTTGGTFYVSESDLTVENAEVVIGLTADVETHKKMVDEIVEISVSGRAPKQNPTLFALAVACQLGETEGKQYARSKVNEVVRTGSHLFTFVKYLQQFGGWSRGLRRAVSNWYTQMDPEKLALQLVKYRQRDGFTHRDVLRLAHPKIEDPLAEDSHLGNRIANLEQVIEDQLLESDAVEDEEMLQMRRNLLDSLHLERAQLLQKRAAIDWTLKKPTAAEHVLPMLYAFDYAQRPGENVAAILDTQYLPWEALPDSAMNDAAVWERMVMNGMPITALVRQLPRLTNVGLLGFNAGMEFRQDIVELLTNADAVAKSLIHPIQVLVALKTYASGRGIRSTWQPDPQVIDALDEMFYLAFKNLEPTNLRRYDALDVSGSMGGRQAGNVNMSAREAGAALAMVSVQTEPRQITVGFSDGQPGNGTYNPTEESMVTDLGFSRRQRLDDVMTRVSTLRARKTDCSLPMLDAIRRDLEVDLFTVITDNETFFGNVHPSQALQAYRKHSGINAKLVVISLTPSKFSIADPRDAGMLDVSGFDAAVPVFINDFALGRV